MEIRQVTIGSVSATEIVSGDVIIKNAEDALELLKISFLI